MIVSFEARKQGYGLTMQQGGAAMEKLGFRAEGISSTSHFVFNPHGSILGFFGRAFRPDQPCNNDANADTMTGTSAGSIARPLDKLTANGRKHLKARAKGRKNRQLPNLHLPRQRLRQRLLDQLDDGTVCWNARYVSHELRQDTACANATEGGCATGRSVVSIKLSDGTEHEASLLVAADGISSPIRAAGLGDRQRYLGVIVALGICTEVELLKRRVVETVDGCTRMYMMPYCEVAAGAAKNLSMWQLSWPASEDDARRLARNPEELKMEALRRCGDWHGMC
eukprot:SAG31_NODE_4357_length_3315_cov_2.653918_3_plen_282_part_00